MKVSKYFRNFLISKETYLVKYQNKRDIKKYDNGIRVCFAKHTLSKQSLGRMGLEPRPGPFLFFTLGWFQPSHMGWARPGPARLLVQTSNRLVLQSCVGSLATVSAYLNYQMWEKLETCLRSVLARDVADFWLGFWNFHYSSSAFSSSFHFCSFGLCFF